MITAGINLLIISVLVLIVGLIKPKWLLFWVDKPGRMPIIMIASVLFMIAMTLFGEGTKRKKEAEAVQTEQPAQPTQPSVSGEQKQVPKKPIPSAQDLLRNTQP